MTGGSLAAVPQIVAMTVRTHVLLSDYKSESLRLHVLHVRTVVVYSVYNNVYQNTIMSMITRGWSMGGGEDGNTD